MDPESLSTAAREMAHELLAGLWPRERLVVRLYFGMEDSRAWKVDEIAALLQTRRGRIRAVLKASLAKMGAAADAGWEAAPVQAAG